MESRSNPRTVAVIPARYASTRFPGKVIAPLSGKPLVLHTYERALEARLVDSAVVATDDERVSSALEPYGVWVMMTRPDHPSGTDRIAEAVARLEADIVVNVQGDEPLIDPAVIDAAIGPMLADPSVPMATVRCPIRDASDVSNPNVVKVVCDQQGRALYFSRCPIPAVRDRDEGAEAACVHWRHIGVYVYRRDFLLAYAAMPQTPLERLEKLEQLRALEHGHAIAVTDVEHISLGVDTPEDLDRVRKLAR